MCPKRDHGDVVKHIYRYPRGTRSKSTILRPNKEKLLELFRYTDFEVNWDPKASGYRDTARSIHFHYINYAGIPVMFKSQLQTDVSLYSTDSEYTGLSYSLRETIPIMELLN